MRSVAFLALLLLPLAVPASASDTTFDWALATVAVPEDTDHLVLVIGVYGDLPAVEFYKGAGVAFGDGPGWISVEEYRSAPQDVSVLVGPVEERVVVQERGHEEWGVGMILSAHGHFRAGDIIRMVVFVPGALFRDADARLEIGGERVPAEVTTGDGSRLLRVGDGIGAALVLDGTATGASIITREASGPLAGALSFQCSLRCESSWTAPDGRTGTWDQEANFGSGNPTFAGDAGTWSWSFRGVQRGEVIGAYAPIGDAAAHFA